MLRRYLEVILDEWDFSVFQLSRISKDRPLTGLALHIFGDSRYHWADLLGTNEFQFEAFVSEIEREYGANIYHNMHHGADVLQSGEAQARTRAKRWFGHRTKLARWCRLFLAGGGGRAGV
jgi:hypothetical protein